MWEIAENLHRAELTVAERATQIAEYAKLVKEKRDEEEETRISAQLGQKVGRSESGDRLAARDLGLQRRQVQRAQKNANRRLLHHHKPARSKMLYGEVIVRVAADSNCL